MEDGKMIFGESLDYEDIKYISGAMYAGMLGTCTLGWAMLTLPAGYDTVRVTHVEL